MHHTSQQHLRQIKPLNSLPCQQTVELNSHAWPLGPYASHRPFSLTQDLLNSTHVQVYWSGTETRNEHAPKDGQTHSSTGQGERNKVLAKPTGLADRSTWSQQVGAVRSGLHCCISLRCERCTASRTSVTHPSRRCCLPTIQSTVKVGAVYDELVYSQ